MGETGSITRGESTAAPPEPPGRGRPGASRAAGRSADDEAGVARVGRHLVAHVAEIEHRRVERVRPAEAGGHGRGAVGAEHALQQLVDPHGGDGGIGLAARQLVGHGVGQLVDLLLGEAGIA